MLKFSRAKTSSACRLSWLLIEVGEENKADYHSIHSVEVLGDFNNIYINRKVRFTFQQKECVGTIRMASDNLKIIENERNRLLSVKANLSKQTVPLKPDLWCLVRQTTDDTKVRLITCSCKKLTFVESQDLNRKHFLMEKDQVQLPVTLLHILDSQKQLFDEMSFLNDTFVKKFENAEKDNVVEKGGLEEAFFLVQYFEDASNLIFTVVKYKDTIWKDKNLFPDVVAYITDGKVISQCIILRKSYDTAELAELLSQIRVTCDNLDYPLLHSHLKMTALKTEDDKDIEGVVKKVDSKT